MFFTLNPQDICAILVGLVWGSVLPLVRGWLDVRDKSFAIPLYPVCCKCPSISEPMAAKTTIPGKDEIDHILPGGVGISKTD